MARKESEEVGILSWKGRGAFDRLKYWCRPRHFVPEDGPTSSFSSFSCLIYQVQMVRDLISYFVLDMLVLTSKLLTRQQRGEWADNHKLSCDYFVVRLHRLRLHLTLNNSINQSTIHTLTFQLWSILLVLPQSTMQSSCWLLRWKMCWYMKSCCLCDPVKMLPQRDWQVLAGTMPGLFYRSSSRNFFLPRISCNILSGAHSAVQKYLRPWFWQMMPKNRTNDTKQSKGIIDHVTPSLLFFSSCLCQRSGMKKGWKVS